MDTDKGVKSDTIRELLMLLALLDDRELDMVKDYIRRLYRKKLN